jgi:hypothetical protein
MWTAAQLKWRRFGEQIFKKNFSFVKNAHRECQIMAELKKAEKNAMQSTVAAVTDPDGDAQAEFEEAKRMHDFFSDLGREKGPIDPVGISNQIEKKCLYLFREMHSMVAALALLLCSPRQMRLQKFPFMI